MSVTRNEILGGTAGYLQLENPDGNLGNSIVFEDAGNVGIGLINPSAKLHLKGIDATSLNYALKVDNLASSPLLYVKNNSDIGFGCDPTNAKFEFSGGNILLLTYGARFGSVAVGGYSSWGLAPNEISTLPVTTGTHLILQYTELGNVGIGTNAPTSRLQVVGLVEYADNAAASGAGLTAGAFYRTGDLLKVVH